MAPHQLNEGAVFLHPFIYLHLTLNTCCAVSKMSAFGLEANSASTLVAS